jgi:hypothetical protein
VVIRYGLEPWKLYRMGRHRVYVVSIEEPKDPGAPVTVKVAVTGQFNFVAMERDVFGVLPEELVECELPGPDEMVGCANMTVEEVRAYLEAERAAQKRRS